MMERAEAEALFVANLPLIERILEILCRRRGLRGDAADDFASWAKARFIEDDYSTLRAFRGDASLTTYLSVVLSMELRQYRVREWGRWRPSAAARRAGPVGIRLETLIHRDGVPMHEATRVVQTAGETGLSDREITGLAATLSRRPPVRPVPVAMDQVIEVAVRDTPAELFVEAIDDAERDSAQEQLGAALDELDAEDRLLVRLTYWEQMSTADIARTLGLEQRPLYRRIKRVLEELRDALERRGVSSEVARTIVASND